MEYMRNGSLMAKLGKSKTLQPHNLWKYFRDIVLGVHYCNKSFINCNIVHECAGVVHRDLKPDNMMLDENDRLKLSDFGVSYIIENGCDEI